MNEIKTKTPMVATVGVIMVISLAGKIMGILRDRMQGVYFGTYSPEAIAFTQAVILPRVFLDVMFAAVFSASFIPVFNRYLETKGQQAAFELAALFIKVIFLVTSVVTIFAILFAGPLYGLLLDGEALAPGVRELGIRLLQIMFPIMIISSLAFSLTGILQSLGEFKIPAAMTIASNGIILLYYFLFIDRFGVYGLAVAFLLGWCCQVLVQVPFLVRIGFIRVAFLKATKSTDTKSTLKGDLREIGKLTLPVMVASWLGPINYFVNFRASVNLYGGEHGVVAINMAHNLYMVIAGIFVLSLANVLFPALSKFAALENWDEYTDYLRNNLRGLLFLLIPMTFGLMAVTQPLVRLIFQGGLFQATSVDITATALFFYAIGMIGFGMQVILSRACFALQDGKGPLVTAVFAIIINIILSFTLAPVMKIGGPALASSIAISVAAAGLFIRLRHKLLLRPIWIRGMTIDLIKMLVLAVIMYGIVSAGYDFISQNLYNRILSLVIPVGLGAGFYMIGSLIFKVPEAKIAMSFLRSIGQ